MKNPEGFIFSNHNTVNYENIKADISHTLSDAARSQNNAGRLNQINKLI